ncbi:MAG: hypothetical protein NZM15_01125 [Flavobacteriales bacterium]|nr:hypothetical protein [Flavobacteriales bacterium]MDW8431285.1 hypothetical protein [Flavobacteriales bacterium]
MGPYRSPALARPAGSRQVPCLFLIPQRDFVLPALRYGLRCKPTQGPGVRWLSRPLWGRIEAPHWQGLQGRDAFHAIF